MSCPIDPQPPSKFQRWGALVAERPELAGLGSAMLVRHGLAYLATVSKVGRPRVTPVSVVFDDGSLFVSLISSTPKCRELQANPFFHLHALPGAGREEFSARGWARIVVDADEFARVRRAHAASSVICGGDDVFFELLLDCAHFASFTAACTGTVPARDRWTSSRRAADSVFAPTRETGGGEPA